MTAWGAQQPPHVQQRHRYPVSPCCQPSCVTSAGKLWAHVCHGHSLVVFGVIFLQHNLNVPFGQRGGRRELPVLLCASVRLPAGLCPQQRANE